MMPDTTAPANVSPQNPDNFIAADPTQTPVENTSTETRTDIKLPANTKNGDAPPAPRHKKTWREYGWEFLMLFLAVFCSYLAELRLNENADRSNEKEYISSLLKDLENDTLQFAKTMQRVKTKIPYYDSVLAFFDTPEKYGNSLPFRFYIKTNLEQFYLPANATLNQLKSSGNLRLIHKQYIIDSIVYYDTRINGGYKNQVDYVIESNKRLIHASEGIFNLTDFNRFINDLSADSTADDVSGYDTKLMTADRERLLEMRNMYITTKATDVFYLQTLRATKQKATNLLLFLKKEY